MLPIDMTPLLGGGTAVAAVLAVIFLVLWLRARGGGGGEERQQLRAAQNEVRLLKGDAIQAKRDHGNEVRELKAELETLRAVAEGRMPPELEQWKQRALGLEKELTTAREQHRVQIEKMAELAAVGGGVEQTMIAPGGLKERMQGLDHNLAEAKQALAEALSSHQGELATLRETLESEKAVALTAQAKRHAVDLDAARRGAPVDPVAVAALAQIEADDSVPNQARFPVLQVMAGAGEGGHHFLPFDTVSIGRSETCAIALEEGAASRVHAEIHFDGRGFTVTDRNSTNGTQLNGELITSAPLTFGDVIGIGETQLRFTCEGHEAAASDPAYAASAYQAMLKLAPDFRPALQGLATLLQQDPARAAEAQALAARLATGR